jgi:hypothetical protein
MHKQQLRRAEEHTREEVAQERARMEELHRRDLEQLRATLATERERALEEERERARLRYQKQLERDEIEFAAAKRKLLAEAEEQRDAAIKATREEGKATEERHRKMLEEHEREMDALRRSKDQALDEVRRRHANEMSALKERLLVEKEEWQAQYVAKTEQELIKKEVRVNTCQGCFFSLLFIRKYSLCSPFQFNWNLQKITREQLVRERDAEIEMVIARLEAETSCSHSDISKRHRGEIERMRRDHAEELRSVKERESMALEKLMASQEQLRECELKRREATKEALSLKNELASKDKLVNRQKSEIERLRIGEEGLKETIREFLHDSTIAL